MSGKHLGISGITGNFDYGPSSSAFAAFRAVENGGLHY